MAKSKLDTNKFFENVNPETSYILGFLWADGNIRGNSINLELCEDDVLDILPIFNTVGDWCVYTRQRYKNGIPFGKKQSKIYASNKELVNFLIDHNYKSRELGQNKILDHIGNSNHIHFWHGFFDGDGCLYVQNTNTSKQTITLQFWSSIEQNWEPFSKYLDSFNICYKIWKYERVKSTGKIHRSSCFGIKNTLKIFVFLKCFYDTDLKGLNRKYEKFKMLENIISQRTKKYPSTGTRYYV